MPTIASLTRRMIRRLTGRTPVAAAAAATVAEAAAAAPPHTEIAHAREADQAPAPAPALAPVREAAGVTIPGEDDTGWTPLTGRAKRDLSSLDQTRAQQCAAYLWEANGLHNRMVELPVAYITAEGVQVTCSDEDHGKWIKAWWNDPINRLASSLPEFARSLALTGELCLPAFFNDVSGHMRLGYLDPLLIDDVVVDPDNPRLPVGVRTKKDTNGKQRTYRVLYRGADADLFTAATRTLREAMTDGECFYFAVNRQAGGRRGRPDGMAMFDWLDAYDEFMFDSLDRLPDLDAFIWDVELTGADPDTVKARAAEIQRPGRGAVRVHNDAEKWTAAAPDIRATDRSESAKLFRNHALGAATLPEHWYGGGGDVNRAVGGEMGDPFFKLTTARQTALGDMLREMAQVLLYRRNLAEGGAEPEWDEEAWTVTIKWPEMVSKDTSRLAAALQSVVAAVQVALTNRLITQATALRIIATAARRLDVDIDPEAELLAVQQEAADNPPLPQPGTTVPPDLAAAAAAAAAAQGRSPADAAAANARNPVNA